MTLIRNIIFDFGGVIYDIDFQAAIAEFQKLGLEDFDQLYSMAIQDKLFENLEIDQCSPQEFIKELKNYFGDGVTENQIEAAWNALLVGFRKERLQLLDDIKPHYNIYLLSNTNRIHYAKFLQEFRDVSAYEFFNDLFNKAYLSFEIKCRKPDLAPYYYVIEDAGMKAHETLFIDDSPQNIRAANELGLHTHLLDLSIGEDVLDLFEENKLKAGIIKT